MARTGCGSPTSPSTALKRVGSTPQSFSTSTPAAWSGWSIADHLRTELVADALDMARLRRKPVGTVVHSDRGTQYTSWLFGHRLREAGLLGSMGRVASAFDNAMIESFFGSMQIELLDRRTWTTRAELATAIFEYIEAFYNPVRRHSALDYRSPIDYERVHTPTHTAA